MANSFYSKGLENFLAGNLDWDANDVRLVLIDEDDDAPVLATDDALDDILAGARVDTSGSFTTKAVTDGHADADDVTLTTVTGDEFESFTIYYHTGTESTSLLMVNIDTATGLPCTPNGGDITIQWDDGTDKIFTL